jgi:DNA-binding XRE family transcriptional regulator
VSSAYIQPTSVGKPAEATDAQTVSAKDVGLEVKRLRRAAAETQAQSAAAIGVTRANLTQWETGKYLPSAENAQQLDDHFRASNALVTLVEAARSPQEHATPATAGAIVVETSGSLAEIFHRVGLGLVEHLIRDGHGKALGWRHNLQTDGHPTALSTAFGMNALMVVGEPYVDQHALVDSLLTMRSPQVNWLGRAGTSRPEITAAVVDVLFRIGTAISVDEGLNLVEDSLDEFSRTRPYLLAVALQTAVRLRPDAPLTTRLIEDLLSTRLDFSGSLLWPEKNEAGLVAPEPSVVHTARAVVALRASLRSRNDGGEVLEAVEEATQWLIDRTHPDDGVFEELIRPKPDGDGTTRIMIRHFTPAWVVQALAAAPQLPLARLNRALRTLWSRYDHERGLWSWGNGDLPIWMTLDAVTALRAATLAVAAPPLSPPGDLTGE